MREQGLSAVCIKHVHTIHTWSRNHPHKPQAQTPFPHSFPHPIAVLPFHLAKDHLVVCVPCLCGPSTTISSTHHPHTIHTRSFPLCFWKQRPYHTTHHTHHNPLTKPQNHPPPTLPVLPLPPLAHTIQQPPPPQIKPHTITPPSSSSSSSLIPLSLYPVNSSSLFHSTN